MGLTLAQKSDVRRHLKYPVAGLMQISPAGANLAQGSAGWRFFQAFGFLEYKMNNLAPDEEARLTGRAYAAAALVGPQPNVGDQVTITLSGGPIPSPQTLTAIAGPAQGNNDMRLNLVASLAAACSLNNVLQAAGILAVAPYGTGPFAQSAVPVPEVAFTAKTTFVIQVGGNGVLRPQITADGSLLPPQAVGSDGVTTLNGYLPVCNALEGDYVGTAQNLDTIRADVWYGMANELGKRRSLYENWVQMLSDYLGTPVNVRARQRPRSSGAVSYA